MSILSLWKTNKSLTALLFGNSLILVAGAMLGPIYAVFVQDLGGNLLNAGMTAGLLALTSGITAFVAGKFTDKIKRTSNILLLGYVLSGVVYLLYIPVNSIWQLYIVQIINGLVITIPAPAFDKLYALHLNKKSTGSEYGEWEATWYISYGIGAIMGGSIASVFGFKAVFIVMSALCFLSACYVKSKHKELL